MKLAIAMLVVLSALAASAAPVRAQEQAQVPAPSIEQRSAELAKWLKEYRAWEKWFEQWGNRVARERQQHRDLDPQEASRTSCLARGRMPG